MSTYSSELYRNADGHEVWRVLRDGEVYMDEVASDHDVRRILEDLTDLDSEVGICLGCGQVKRLEFESADPEGSWMSCRSCAVGDEDLFADLGPSSWEKGAGF